MSSCTSRDLVVIYLSKRLFCFLDEWLLYLVLLHVYRRRYPAWFVIGVLIYGTLGVITGYKNLCLIERAIGMNDHWLFWPFFREKKIEDGRREGERS